MRILMDPEHLELVRAYAAQQGWQPVDFKFAAATSDLSDLDFACACGLAGSSNAGTEHRRRPIEGVDYQAVKLTRVEFVSGTSRTVMLIGKCPGNVVHYAIVRTWANAGEHNKSNGKSHN